MAAALYGVAGASADEIDDAFAAIAAASADEKRIAAELDGLREELAAVRLRIEVPGMEPDDPLTAEAGRIDEALAGAYDALAQLGTEQARVNRERAILEAWLETFGPAAGSLGLGQFRALTGELAGLRAAGTIPSTGPALDGAPAVRQRLRELIGTAEQLGTRDDAERARLHGEIEALQRERDALELQRNSAPIRFDAAVLSAWQELSRAVAIRGAELQGVRDRIQNLAEQVVLLLGRTGPPYLVELHASTTGGPVYYHARWEAARQGNGDESLKARRLIDAERALIQALGEIGSTREALREPRQYLGEQMAVESKIINEAAADWSTYKQRGIVVVAMVDIVMTVVEAAAGNAPGALAGKSAELALALEKMTGARVAANALLEAGPRAAGELAERVAAARATRNQAIRAVRGAFTVLVEEATEQEVAKGTPRAMAALLAERRLLPLQEQVVAKVSRQLSEENSALLADAQTELINTIQREAAAAGMDITSVLNDPTRAKAIADALLKEGITGPGAKAAAAGIGTLYDDRLSRALGADGDIVGHTSELANTLIGDLVENGLKTIAYGAFGADGLSREALARFTSFRGAGGQVLANIKAGYSANATGTLISLVSTAVKSGAAAYYDLKTNAASDRFWQAFAASETLQRRYNALIEDDKVLWDIELRLKHALLAVQAELAMLRGDREKVVLADQPVPAVDTRVELLFTFSTGLVEPPLLQNGDFSRPMQPVGPLPARTWTAPTLGCYLEDGQITAALGPGSRPFAALDADPTRPAVKEPGIPEPRNYEAGPDRNHIIKLAFDRGPVPGRNPLEGCWIGMGGYLLLQPSGDGWSGWIGHPHSHQQLNDITIDADRLTAKVLAPDGSPDTDLDLAAQTRRRLAGKWVLRNTFQDGREVPAQYVHQPWELQPPPQ